jgi:hypothetical protein
MTVPRRVVTGHDAEGRSIVLSDGPTPRSHDIGPAVFHELWNTQAMPAPIAPSAPEPTARPLVTPPDPDGTVVRITEIKAGERSPMLRATGADGVRARRRCLHGAAERGARRRAAVRPGTRHMTAIVTAAAGGIGAPTRCAGARR